MQTTLILVGGAYLEPKAYLLMRELLLHLVGGGMPEFAEHLRQHLFATEGVLRREPVGGEMTHLSVWRLTDHGELLLRDLIGVAERSHDPQAERARRLYESMALAGYGTATEE